MQLRDAYEKQLKARETAENQKTKKVEDTSRVVAKETAVAKPANDKTTKVKLPDQSAEEARKSSSDSKSKDSKARSSSSKRSGGSKDKKKKDKVAKASKKSEQNGTQAENVAKAKAREKEPNDEDDGSHGSRTEDEEAAGTILIGFLSSLRDSYEDAVRKKSSTTSGDSKARDQAETPAKKSKKRPRQESESSSKKLKVQQTPKISNSSSDSAKAQEEAKPKAKEAALVKKATVKNPESDAAKSAPKQAAAEKSVSASSSLADSYRQFTAASLQSRRTTPAYITDMSTSTSEASSGNNSTNPVESSLEDSDSNSDKCGDINSEKGKADTSSEEDDKEVGEGRGDRFRSKGPPRKRLKSKKLTDEMPRPSEPVAAAEKAAD